MKEFFHYFFGAGKEVEFVNFSLAHILPILFMGIIIALIIYFREKVRNFKYEEQLRITLAFIAIISEMSYFWRLVGITELNPNPIDHLPITICGWSIVFCSFLALTKNKTLYDITYFWALCGTIFALITPTVITYTGPTRFRYYQFWVEHTMCYIIIFYMTFVHKMRPTWISMIKSYALLVVLAIIAYIANNTLGPGANYLFMARPESTKSILDILPSNYALRISIMAFAVTVLFFITYLPWFIIDIKKKEQQIN